MSTVDAIIAPLRQHAETLLAEITGELDELARRTELLLDTRAKVTTFLDSIAGTTDTAAAPTSPGTPTAPVSPATPRPTRAAPNPPQRRRPVVAVTETGVLAALTDLGPGPVSIVEIRDHLGQTAHQGVLGKLRALQASGRVHRTGNGWALTDTSTPAPDPEPAADPELDPPVLDGDKLATLIRDYADETDGLTVPAVVELLPFSVSSKLDSHVDVHQALETLRSAGRVDRRRGRWFPTPAELAKVS